jgi:hypothetical protein
MTQDVPPIPQLPPEIFMPGPTPMEIAGAVALVVATIGSVAILWLFVRGWLRRWSSPPPPDGGAIQELRHTVHQLSAEVGELQERLDFAERVLASRGEPERLDRGER